MKYYIVSYSKNTNEVADTVPTTQNFFDRVKKILGPDFDPYGDCFELTQSVCNKINKAEDPILDLTNFDYYLERTK